MYLILNKYEFFLKYKKHLCLNEKKLNYLEKRRNINKKILTLCV